MAKPQGTMEMVLGQLIKLTDEEKAEAIRQLHTAYDTHQRQKAGTK
jgi:hypothetical protein